ncbi:MAG: PQQ-binding-like beta-propeller repeat protein [Coriobacteriales bacterium]|nr:PQQ-binding-like beta-propeller repeat protein [Coriobacteriales bacterium]
MAVIENERNYIAFISYRHRPLDMEVAKRLHKRIEHFIIPKDLRKDGQKKLGLVFRDQDELPISSNLSANIEEALDRSQFLIVVCTPETPKSKWVEREISYFLEHHDRDHVLAVLADGLPETSFPPQLMEGGIEPLAANILADNDRKRWKLFRVESLRILASLVGCPFDALYRREQRYRRRRSAILLAIVGLVVAAFIGMLINRNMQIKAQLEQSQRNESLALSTLSQSAFKEGDYNGALEYALQALPGPGGERPYVPAAEFALSSELGLYDKNVLHFEQSLRQESSIEGLDLSPNAELIATFDAYGTLRVFDAATGAQHWSSGQKSIATIEFVDDEHLLAVGGSGATMYSAGTGETLWEREDINTLTIGFQLRMRSDGRYDAVNPVVHERGLLLHTDNAGSSVLLTDLESGQDVRNLQLFDDGTERYCIAAALNRDANLAALVVRDTESNTAHLYFCDLDFGETYEHPQALPFSPVMTAYALRFSAYDDLLMACDDMEGDSFVRVYAHDDDWHPRFTTVVEAEKILQVVNGEPSYYAQVDLFDAALDRAIIGSKHELSMVNLETGELLWHHTLPGAIRGGCVYSNVCLSLVLSDGTVCFCTDDGVLTYTQDVYSANVGFPVAWAIAQGASYAESSFVLVSNDDLKRLMLLRFANGASMVEAGSTDDLVYRVCLVSSPNGKMIAGLGIGAYNSPVRVLLLDVDAGGSWNDFDLPLGYGFEDLGRLSMGDDGVLRSTGYSLDLRTQELSEGGDPNAGANDVLPETVGMSALPQALCRLMLTSGPAGHELLLAFSETGELRIIDVASGEVLHSYENSNSRVHFSATDTIYSARMNDGGDRLLVFVDNGKDVTSLCMVFDVATWECVGAFERVGAYLPGDDAVAVTPYLSGVYLSPFWNLDDMVKKAEAIVSREG